MRPRWQPKVPLATNRLGGDGEGDRAFNFHPGITDTKPPPPSTSLRLFDLALSEVPDSVGGDRNFVLLAEVVDHLVLQFFFGISFSLPTAGVVGIFSGELVGHEGLLGSVDGGAVGRQNVSRSSSACSAVFPSDRSLLKSKPAPRRRWVRGPRSVLERRRSRRASRLGARCISGGRSGGASPSSPSSVRPVQHRTTGERSPPAPQVSQAKFAISPPTSWLGSRWRWATGRSSPGRAPMDSRCSTSTSGGRDGATTCARCQGIRGSPSTRSRSRPSAAILPKCLVAQHPSPSWLLSGTTSPARYDASPRRLGSRVRPSRRGHAPPTAGRPLRSAQKCRSRALGSSGARATCAGAARRLWALSHRL